jgi:uncharacterized protein Smg (DUF494 family)
MIPYGKPFFSADSFNLTAEGGVTFFQYLKKFHLFREPELLILSPNIHFYYDESDLKEVKTFILLRKLNLIKDLDNFVKTLSLMLPPGVNFVGCFSDNKTLKWDGFVSNISNKITNILDFKTDNLLDKDDVRHLLEKYGFKIVDITQMNELILFYSKTVPRPE